ncbi:Gas vesicle protein G [Synechococcus sp. PCC 7502]|uniref:gas vesicle protein GvpG n=1 Tax=Synechococcus sp. PCC 7502 TaxID=1173263 RepID=UPI00029FF1CB|nr:gas vesicle protein GvpG [Synechococcus sp. PCC 7502]AFY74966.1 Gas vesicle protein G [Synechococcus sp. PCC 7502]
MLLKLLTFPVDSFIWIAEQVQDRVLTELEDQENLSKKLTKLQIQFDLGEIEEEEFMILEQDLLERMEAQIIAQDTRED